MGQFAGPAISNGDEIGPRLVALETMVHRLCLRLPPDNLIVSEFGGLADGRPQTHSFPDGRARMVRGLLARRRRRTRYFPADLFADPAWDMLLDLYAAHYEKAQVSSSSLCIAAAVPATTALRWIASMTEAGWLEREADPKDKRRILIRISEVARVQLDRYFDDIKM